jgi:hypothetical protein
VSLIALSRKVEDIGKVHKLIFHHMTSTFLS